MRCKFKWILTLIVALLFQLSFAQEKTITGVVTDIIGPLSGANVIIKGTNRGVTTNFDGGYSIKANVGDVLVFSYVGTKDTSIVIGEANTYNVTLKAEELSEVVVTGALGIQRKPDELTTSSQVIKSDEINQAKNPNAIQSLTGKVTGLQINTISTGVNPATEIVLRGNKSITGSNQALIVIDNVITNANALSNLDPNLIESINVLKGASGSALYGSVGGNGAIIVTTKKGNKQKGKVTVDITSSVTFEEIAFLPQKQDRYGKGYWGEIDAFDQGSWGPEYDGSIQPVGLPYPTFNDFRYNTYDFRKDNVKDFFQTGTTLQNSLIISGGDNEGYFTLGYNKRNTEGIIPNDEFTRDVVSLNTGKTFGKLKLSGIARYSIDKSNVVSSYDSDANNTNDRNLYQQLTQVPSDVDVTQFNSGSNQDHWTAFGDSPYWIMNNSRAATRGKRFEINLEGQYKFNKNINLTYRTSINDRTYRFVDYLNDFNATYTITGDSRDISSTLQVQTGNSRIYTNDLLANFIYDLTEDINLNAIVGASTWENNTYFHDSFGRDLTIPGFYDLSNISSSIAIDEDKFTSRNLGVFANLDLGYKDYLFLNLTARKDYNSALNLEGKKVKDLGFFYPSAGVSFIPTKAFPELKGKILHKAKVSASYVKVGNVTGLAPHSIIDTGIQPAAFPYTSSGLNSFILPNRTTDKEIEPEFVTSLEGNINLELLNIRGTPRLTFDASYSETKNSNQILTTSVSSSTGVSAATINVGQTTSSALELDLGFTPIKNENFEWSANIGYFTFETNVDKVTNESTSVATSNGTPATYAIVGNQFPVIQGTYYERDELGRVVLDSNGAPKLGSGIKVLGKTTPDYILNFGTQIRYKGFTLKATADYRTGHQFYSGIYQDLTTQGRSYVTAENGRGYFIFPNSTIEGSGVTNTTVLTGPSFSGPSPYAKYQDYIQSNYTTVDENFIVDATAFKVREVSLSYSLPSKFLKDGFINACTFGISGRNLLVILPKENRGYNDPELAGAIGGYGQTPPTKFYTMSINLIF
ncbi:SusC/RagA family TonB-linked outer membrane protein [Flavobacterium jejuense]|uniref:SusC/RagA family TonB-linked outer membrane protein n=1 Tax=Flavobacterium jejuense TaxID=1544455 RepID=A0ABX0IU43_9FLAO|nr:SusC/RagA family TonB-linked outer membrane protein [Flavobacterium jejuense]NHN26053.1 SusC/RagA family TonB-linked outer membrane protein [Flavobacterium jejuense]